jgi:hypothetical protein
LQAIFSRSAKGNLGLRWRSYEYRTREVQGFNLG